MTRTPFLALALLGTSLCARAAGPAVDIHQAIAIAEKSLKNRGLTSEVYITSAVLQQTTLLNGRAYWFVQWSHPVAGDKKSDKEVGVKVLMDGTATRLVKAPF